MNGMKAGKAMTIRLSVEQAQELETVASVDDLPIVDVIRAAISEHVETRKKDSEFQQNLRSRIQQAQSMLDR